MSIETLVKELKYSREQVDDSLKNKKYDEIMATYMLLAARTSEVLYVFFCFCLITISCFINKFRCFLIYCLNYIFRTYTPSSLLSFTFKFNYY